MRKQWVIGLGVLGIALGAGAWVLSRPAPLPAAPIDYEAELIKLTLEGQSTDPNAVNGWDALVGVGADAGAISTSIVDRETDADQTLRLTGKEAEIESWSWEPLGGWGCEPRTPRDDRISAEAWQRVTDEHILDRLKSALAHDVFVMDFDQRLGAQMRGNWANVQTSAVPSRLRALSKVLTRATEHAIDEGDWDGAIDRIRDQMALARVAGLQPDLATWLISPAARSSVGRTVADAMARDQMPPQGFLVAVRDILRDPPPDAVDMLIDAQCLEAKEMIDVSGDVMLQGGMTSKIMATLRGWTSSTEARKKVDEWAARIRGMQRTDPRQIAADIASIESAIAGVEGIHALGLHSMGSAARALDWNATQQRNADIADIKLAIGLFASTHGAPPQTLDALVPEFLAHVPTDPWAPDGKYRYIPGPTMKDVVLYTVGWDGQDDGGKYVPERADRALTEGGAGLDSVFTRDPCEHEPEHPSGE